MYGETNVTMSVRDTHYEATEELNGSKIGLNFAFAVTDYDDVRTPIEEDRFGRVEAKHVTWGDVKESSTTTGVADSGLTTHLCSQQELGLVSGEEEES